MTEAVFERQLMLKKISEIMATTFEIESSQIHAETRLVEDLDLDSIDLVELAMQLQEVTQLDVQVDELRTVQTIDDVLQVIQKTMTQA